jgi:hypothetical protein
MPRGTSVISHHTNITNCAWGGMGGLVCLLICLCSLVLEFASLNICQDVAFYRFVPYGVSATCLLAVVVGVGWHRLIHTQSLLSSQVAPVMSGRLIDTPTQAARFVSLLPHEVARGVGRGRDGGAKVEQWSHPHTTLSRGCGDVEDHASLLCGLFLGLGLDA